MSQQNTQSNKPTNTIGVIVGVILVILVGGAIYLLNNNDTTVPGESADEQEQVDAFNDTTLRDFDGNPILDEDGNEQEIEVVEHIVIEQSIDPTELIDEDAKVIEVIGTGPESGLTTEETIGDENTE